MRSRKYNFHIHISAAVRPWKCGLPPVLWFHLKYWRLPDYGKSESWIILFAAERNKTSPLCRDILWIMNRKMRLIVVHQETGKLALPSRIQCTRRPQMTGKWGDCWILAYAGKVAEGVDLFVMYDGKSTDGIYFPVGPAHRLDRTWSAVSGILRLMVPGPVSLFAIPAPAWG